MNIFIRNSSDKPIYEQIKEQLKDAIISGELKPGEKLPSIRFLAKEIRVSVITTKRAYDELEKEGFISSVQGKGSFVAGQNEEIIKEEQLRNIEEGLNKVLELAESSGIDLDELIEILKILKEERDG
ncbi:GntR family transcriptional regulator [Miniphocaeibacter massiliensis]|uniref:GntR family transcriptional regulator n=1 Tax=Miniphocaeibacter massiliensis TaxID=2041841 RepID=UPI000C1C40ED|nr:GntR family transcriptional regulator [Miniphocaeibacter massiliensis]